MKNWPFVPVPMQGGLRQHSVGRWLLVLAGVSSLLWFAVQLVQSLHQHPLGSQFAMPKGERRGWHERRGEGS